MDKEQAKFYIQSAKDNFSNARTIVFPQFVKDHKRRHFIIHSIIAIVVGISVPYFLIDFSVKTYHKFTTTPDQKVEAVKRQETFNSNNEKSLGSDDGDGLADDTPQGGETPVNPELKGQYYFLGPNYKVPNTSGLAYVVADADTGEVIIEKNPDMIMPIASISKLITTLVAKENTPRSL